MSASSTDLANLRDGRAALERARDLGEIREVKKIGDVAAAAKRLAEAQGMSEDARRFAAELELDAKRTLGELLARMPKNAGRAEPGPRGNQRVPRGAAEVIAPSTLEEHGVTKRQSSEAQRLARIPDDEWQEFKAATPADGLSTRRALAVADDVTRRDLAPIIDAGERDLRLRRARARRQLAEAEAAGALLHVHAADVVEAAQHDGRDRHAPDLRESARLLCLVADQIDQTQLRRVK